MSGDATPPFRSRQASIVRGQCDCPCLGASQHEDKPRSLTCPATASSVPVKDCSAEALGGVVLAVKDAAQLPTDVTVQSSIKVGERDTAVP